MSQNTDDLLRQILNAIERGGMGGSSSRTTGYSRNTNTNNVNDTLDELSKQFIEVSRSTTKTIKSSNLLSNVFDVFGKKHLEKSRKSLDDLDRVIRTLKDTMEEMGDNLSEDQKRNIQQDIKSAQAHKAELQSRVFATDSIHRFGSTLFSTSKQISSILLASVGNIASIIQSGGSGFALAGAAAETYVDSLHAVSSGLTNFATQTGTAMMMMGGRARVAGMGLTAVGTAAGIAGDALAQLAKVGVRIMMSEGDKVIQTYQNLTSSGVVFGSGLVGIGDATRGTMLRLEDMAEVVASNRDKFGAMGMSMAEATRRIGGVSKVLTTTRMDRELLALGYSYKEQAALAAEVYADMRKSMNGAHITDAQVANATKEYAENLSLIAALTGEDVKTKQAKIREENNNLFMQNLFAKMEENVAGSSVKLQGAFAGMSDIARHSLLDMIATQGHITNQKGALVAGTNVAFKKMMDDFYASYNEGTLDAKKASSINNQYSMEVVKGARKVADSMGAAAHYVTDTGKVLTDGQNEVLQDGLRHRADLEEVRKEQERIRKLSARDYDPNDPNSNPTIAMFKAIEVGSTLTKQLQETLIAELGKLMPTLDKYFAEIHKALKHIDDGGEETTNHLKDLITGIAGVTLAIWGFKTALDAVTGIFKKLPSMIGGGVPGAGGAGSASKLGAVAKGLGWSAAAGGLFYLGDELKEKGHDELSSAANIAGTTVAGGIAGGVLGSLAGPGGALVGGKIGATIGAGIGAWLEQGTIKKWFEKNSIGGSTDKGDIDAKVNRVQELYNQNIKSLEENGVDVTSNMSQQLALQQAMIDVENERKDQSKRNLGIAKDIYGIQNKSLRVLKQEAEAIEANFKNGTMPRNVANEERLRLTYEQIAILQNGNKVEARQITEQSNARDRVAKSYEELTNNINAESKISYDLAGLSLRQLITKRDLVSMDLNSGTIALNDKNKQLLANLDDAISVQLKNVDASELIAYNNDERKLYKQNIDLFREYSIRKDALYKQELKRLTENNTDQNILEQRILAKQYAEDAARDEYLSNLKNDFKTYATPTQKQKFDSKEYISLQKQMKEHENKLFEEKKLKLGKNPTENDLNTIRTQAKEQANKDFSTKFKELGDKTMGIESKIKKEPHSFLHKKLDTVTDKIKSYMQSNRVNDDGTLKINDRNRIPKTEDKSTLGKIWESATDKIKSFMQTNRVNDSHSTAIAKPKVQNKVDDSHVSHSSVRTKLEGSFSEYQLMQKDRALYDRYNKRKMELYDLEIKKLEKEYGKKITLVGDERNEVLYDAQLKAMEEFMDEINKVGAGKLKKEVIISEEKDKLSATELSIQKDNINIAKEMGLLKTESFNSVLATNMIGKVTNNLEKVTKSNNVTQTPENKEERKDVNNDSMEMIAMNTKLTNEKMDVYQRSVESGFKQMLVSLNQLSGIMQDNASNTRKIATNV